MKISPENLIADKDLCLSFKSFFISGNDENYIQSLRDLLLEIFTNKGFLKKDLSGVSGLVDDLFKAENKSVYVCDKFPNNNLVEEIEHKNDVFICFEKSSAKNKSTKHFFSKAKERALLECYELDQNKKKIILNDFIKKNNLVFDNNVYWFLLEVLDDRFSILSKELDKVLLLEDKNNAANLESALNAEKKTDANKFFFKVYLSRPEVVSFLNSSINSLSDFYSYFSYFKIYSFLLIGCENKQDLDNRIPKYLFREKPIFVKLFNSLNKDKKQKLSSLLYKTENLVRKSPSLYRPLFFRFVLNYKKIIS